jgi:gluconate 5-dehydrogenase
MNEAFKNAFTLENQRAVITGGATGLGFAMAKCMVAAGAEVVLTSRSEEQLEKACAELGEKASYYVFDITDFSHSQELADRIIREKGKVSILCNNAGNHCKKPIEDMTVEDFTSVLNVHAVGAFAITKAFVPHMKANKRGSIIFTSSMTGFLGQPYVTGYAAAKSALLGMVRSLATEISADGIRVNAIAPGWIDTPMLRKAIKGDDERKNKILGRTPMNKFGDAEDIGWASVFLCSEAAKFINGTTLVVDGGALIGF